MLCTSPVPFSFCTSRLHTFEMPPFQVDLPSREHVIFLTIPQSSPCPAFPPPSCNLPYSPFFIPSAFKKPAKLPFSRASKILLPRHCHQFGSKNSYTVLYRFGHFSYQHYIVTHDSRVCSDAGVSKPAALPVVWKYSACRYVQYKVLDNKINAIGLCIYYTILYILSLF